MIHKEGPLTLFSGLSSAIVGGAISYFIYFLTYKLSGQITSKLELGLTAESLINSFVAGLNTAVLTNPIWVLNTRMAQANSIVIE